MKQRIIYFLLLWLPFTSCIKELEGPNTFIPKDPVRYGTVVIYTDWADLGCPIVVTLDDENIGSIDNPTQTANCYDNFTITVDSVSEGVHVIYAADCDTVSWEVKPDILADQCNRIKLSL